MSTLPQVMNSLRYALLAHIGQFCVRETCGDFEYRYTYKQMTCFRRCVCREWAPEAPR